MTIENSFVGDHLLEINVGLNCRDYQCYCYNYAAFSFMIEVAEETQDDPNFGDFTGGANYDYYAMVSFAQFDGEACPSTTDDATKAEYVFGEETSLMADSKDENNCLARIELFAFQPFYNSGYLWLDSDNFYFTIYTNEGHITAIMTFLVASSLLI
mmetsp:Transcript_14752/g.10651  ORF Transcript_14752/g.10651 Transcript_14752/m.10651 type:complete len:156 (-) Transcript_14752:37-504(-)